MNTFSENLKKYRTEKKYSQRKLAELSSIPQSAIANYETGKWVPNFHTITALASALEIPFVFLKPFNAEDYDEEELIYYAETKRDYLFDFYELLESAQNNNSSLEGYDEVLNRINHIIKKHEGNDDATVITNRLSQVYSSCTDNEKKELLRLAKILQDI